MEIKSCKCGKPPTITQNGTIVTHRLKINYHGMTHLSCAKCHIDILDWVYDWAVQTWNRSV